MIDYDNMNLDELMFQVPGLEPSPELTEIIMNLYKRIKELKEVIHDWEDATGYPDPYTYRYGDDI